MTEALSTAIQIARDAGEIIMEYYGSDLNVQFKQNEFDPVTLADKKTDEFIRESLSEAFPEDEILSEENEARPDDYNKSIWMVDPLDGTKEFVANRPAFSVIIGMLKDKIPELGVVYNPVTKDLYYAESGKGAFLESGGVKKELHVNNTEDLRSADLVTRNHVKGDVRQIDQTLDALEVRTRIPQGSVGLKIGMIASGNADIFVHTNTMACKWDTLGPEVILTEAGGIIRDIEGNPLDYTKKLVNWDKYFIAATNLELISQVYKAIK